MGKNAQKFDSEVEIVSLRHKKEKENHFNIFFSLWRYVKTMKF